MAVNRFVVLFGAESSAAGKPGGRGIFGDHSEDPKTILELKCEAGERGLELLFVSCPCL